MKEVKRLQRNIKILIDTNMFDEEFEALAQEYPNLDSIKELNNLIETEISYWEE